MIRILILINNMLTAAIIGGVVALGGIIANSISTNSTNNANKELQAKQQAFDKQQIKEQNEYNDPSAQRERMEKAGFNPFAMEGGASSISQGATQKNVAKSQQLTSLNPLEGISGNAQNMVNSFVSNANAVQMNQSQMSKNQQDIQESLSRMKGNKLQNSILQKTGLQAAQTNIQKQQNDARAVELENRSRLVNAKIDEELGSKVATTKLNTLAANYANTVAANKNIKLTSQKLKADTMLTLKKVVMAHEQATGQKLDNDQKQRLFDAAIQAKLNQFKQIETQSKRDLFNLNIDYQFQQQERALGIHHMRASYKESRARKQFIQKQDQMYKENSRWKNINGSISALSQVANTVGKFMGKPL